jgi:hypothetical protein
LFMEYIGAVMEQAKYRVLGDKNDYGEIPGFHGVWASEKNPEERRKVLREVLEEWVLLKVRP